MRKFFAVLVILLCGCAKMVPCASNNVYVPPPVIPVKINPIQQIVNLYNQYRLSVNEPILTKGLSCSLYTVPNTTLSIARAREDYVGTFTYTGVFNQPNVPAEDGLNILPPSIQSFYTQWFIVKCSGNLVIPNSDFYRFDLSSDDGSLLYIDGEFINNDGLHSVETVSNVKYLSTGIHSFELDYLEGPAGYEALILDMNEKVLNSEYFWH